MASGTSFFGLFCSVSPAYWLLHQKPVLYKVKVEDAMAQNIFITVKIVSAVVFGSGRNPTA